MKITDMQAACGVAQLDRLEDFVEKRKENFAFMTSCLAPLEDKLILPRATANANPSWFGYPITMREGVAVSRRDLLLHLDSCKIGTRLLFAGNITKQPYFKDLNYRIVGELTNTDIIMNNTFWLGIYPAITEEMMQYIAMQLDSCLNGAQ
jgi:CDP-6-deoxy-D-xylo-4-hexulose-3-dehydrase